MITPEYPPDLGGVADYSAIVADGLREAGHEVHVWCPSSGRSGNGSPYWVHRQRWGLGLRGLLEISKGLAQFSGPRTVLVQWVPHGYGWRAMNVAFCLWLLVSAVKGHRVEVMLHEAFLPLRGGSWRQAAAALVQRFMTCILLASTRKVWLSSPSWRPRLLPYSLGKHISFTWLPIPSSIPVTATPGRVAETRKSYTPNGESLLGHFGTF